MGLLLSCHHGLSGVRASFRHGDFSAGVDGDLLKTLDDLLVIPLT
ncbi:hypothetical protein [Corynebacterium belfantii]|nr:hypothetical protein [Corynebacterium belfantii]